MSGGRRAGAGAPWLAAILRWAGVLWALGAGMALAGPPTVPGPGDDPIPPRPPARTPAAPAPRGEPPAPPPLAEPALPTPAPVSPEPTPSASPRSLEITAATVAFDARLRQAGTRDPVKGALVGILDGPGGAVTDEEGRFLLPEAPVGYAVLTVEIPGQERALLPVEIPADTAGRAVDLYIRLPEESGTMVITGERDDPPITERVLALEELRRSPGAQGDAVRAVQNLPGVGWAPLGLGLLIVRGTYPEDSGFFVDGVSIPLIYHFLGLRTVINTDFLERLTFMPGGFGVRYGRVKGGVIDLGTRMSHDPRLHGYAEVDLFMSTFYASGPIDSRTGFTVSLRRSYIDKVLNPVLDRLVLEYYIQAPRFWDYQVAVDRWLGDRHHLRLMVLGSTDSLAVFGRPPPDSDEEAVQQALFDYEVGVKQLQLRWDASLGQRFISEATLSVGPQPNRLNVGGATLIDVPLFTSLREEIRGELTPNVNVRGGLDAQLVHQNIRLEEDGQVSQDVEPVDAWTASLSPYLEASITPLPALTLVPGLRMDPLLVQGQPNLISVDPRLAVRYRLDEETALKGSAGRYTAFPGAYELLEPWGNPDLIPEHSLQGSVGVERRLGPRLDLDVVGYYNRHRDVVSATPFTGSVLDVLLDGSAEPEAVVPYNNEGQGRAYGAEILLRRRMGAQVWGWVAYALQRSQVRSDAEAEWRRFDYDQTHLLTVVGVAELPRGFNLGGRLRYGTGRPYTPVVGRVYNIDNGTYSPVIGDTNSARYPALFTMDVRVERTWVFDRWQLVGYLSVENATNHKNVESHYYSWDYLKQYYITGLPILPIFGVRGSY